ncbi:MAG: hypothetical protein LBV52_02890 [Spirochaetaceae bacterium]|jgi:hypothetical protein|nr:hypothetical protein [Spirochaetaceae bacterium]
MRKLYIIIALVFLTLQFLAAQPIELTISGGVDSGAVATGKVDGMPQKFEDTLSVFTPFWQGKLYGRFGKIISFDFEVHQDPFWQATNRGGIGLFLGVIQIGLGFQFGLPDFDRNKFLFFSADGWDSGLTGLVKLEFPGIFFIKSEFVANLKGDTDFVGNSDRQFLSFSAGIWLPNILVTGSYFTKDYSETKDTFWFRTSYVKFFGRAEFFAKKVPFHLALEGGYITQSMVLSWDNTTWSDKISASYWYPSIEFIFMLSNYLNWNIRADLPFSDLYPQLDKFTVQTGLVFTILGNK